MRFLIHACDRIRKHADTYWRAHKPDRKAEIQRGSALRGYFIYPQRGHFGGGARRAYSRRQRRASRNRRMRDAAFGGYRASSGYESAASD